MPVNRQEITQTQSRTGLCEKHNGQPTKQTHKITMLDILDLHAFEKTLPTKNSYLPSPKQNKNDQNLAHMHNEQRTLAFFLLFFSTSPYFIASILE